MPKVRCKPEKCCETINYNVTNKGENPVSPIDSKLMGQAEEVDDGLLVPFIFTGKLQEWSFYIYAESKFNHIFSKKEFLVKIEYNCRFDRLIYKVFDEKQLIEMALP